MIGDVATMKIEFSFFDICFICIAAKISTWQNDKISQWGGGGGYF